MIPSIEFRGVSKFFGNIIALKDISFKVFKGEITALLGDNGAGKSTLIKLLSGVHMPSAVSYTHLTLPTMFEV